MSSADTLVILVGGLRPPSYLMSLLVGLLSCPWMLLLSSVDTLAILEMICATSLLMILLVRALTCLWMLLLSSVDTRVILEGGLRPPSFCHQPPLLIGVLSYPWMLLLSPVDTLAILQGGLRLPSFLMRLLCGALSCLWTLPVSSHPGFVRSR